MTMKKNLARSLISLVSSDGGIDVVDEKEPDIVERVKSDKGDGLGFVCRR